MTQYIELDWESPWSPLYGSTINIPENTIIWRSYLKSKPSIGNRFAYYSSQSVAAGYKQNNTRELGHFISTRPLRLLDYRFMRILLTRLIYTNSYEKTIQEFAAIMLSFGLCSLRHQIDLVVMRYKDLDKTTKEYKQIEQARKALEDYYKPHSTIEQIGVRIAETTNDIYTMGFLQELFKGIFDGFISPRMYSPFHIEKAGYMMSPEIVIFNPLISGITELKSYPNSTKIKVLKISEVLNMNHGHILINNVKRNKEELDIKLDFFMYGGNSLNHLDEQLDNNDSELIKEYNKGRKAGLKWNKKIDIRMIYTPAPYVTISPFSFELGV